jgi:hypothetical protein
MHVKLRLSLRSYVCTCVYMCILYIYIHIGHTQMKFAHANKEAQADISVANDQGETERIRTSCIQTYIHTYIHTFICI